MEQSTQINEINEFNGESDVRGFIISRIAAIKAQLEAIKPLYEELDTLTVQLADSVPAGTSFILGDDTVTLVDNFAEKNTVFRPTGVKRFEVQIENTIEKLAKQAKRDKKKKD